MTQVDSVLRTVGFHTVLGFTVLGSQLAAQDVPDIPFPTTVPLGLEEMRVPPDNPMTEEVFGLGRRLYFDPILSADKLIACASCHAPEHGYASPDRLPGGVFGRKALRNSPTLFNRGLGTSQRWDGKTATLEEQVLLPIEDPNEMDLSLEDALVRLGEVESYREAFDETFDDGLTERNLSRALATFVRGLTYGNSRPDRFIAGERSALSKVELAGMWIYESKGRCWSCHSRPNFSDDSLQNTGIGVVDGKSEPGRQAVTGLAADAGKFKVPTLRGLTMTAPYMHDGSLATLEEVVEFYRRGGNPNPGLSEKIKPLDDMTDEDAANLVAFLKALTRSESDKD